MPSRFLFLYFFILFGTCKGLWLNVTRGTQNTERRDLFSNLDLWASCPNRRSSAPDAGRIWCQERKGECSSQGCCICRCKMYDNATFQMNVDPYLSYCVGNRDIRKLAGCSKTFALETQGQPLATLDLAQPGSKDVPYLPHKYSCDVESAEYLNITWTQLPKKETDTFSIRSIGGWIKNELRDDPAFKWDRNFKYRNFKWTGAMTPLYFGYIIKTNWECSQKGHIKQNGCVVFKAKGTLSRSLPNPITTGPHVPGTTKLSTTTKSPKSVSTRKVTTPPGSSTAQAKSTMPVVVTTGKTSMKTTLSSTVGKTSAIFSTKAPSSKQTTARASSSSSLPVTLQTTSSSTLSHEVTESFTESVAATSETLSTESTVGDMTTTELATHGVGSREPNKDQNKLNGEEDENDNMMIAIVAGVAAVISVAIVLLCIWLIVSWRRKHRHGGSFGTGTTVIANPTTGSQNHFPMPGLLKNPVCEDSVYADPQEKVHKSAVGLLGNPCYETCDDLLLKNPGAKDSHSLPLNNIQKKPLNTAKRIPHSKENTYNCADIRSNHGEKPNGEKSVYQSLVKETARVRYKPEVNVPTYQSLNPDSLMYQPLIKNMAQKHQEEIPEYLVLLNPSDSTGKISPSPPEYQPPYSTGPPPVDVEESAEYADYADLDELEEISANEASGRSSDEAPSYSAPLYNVLEGPSYDYASAPMYAVLEGPDPNSVGNTNMGFEPPMYAVLEGPD